MLYKFWQDEKNTEQAKVDALTELELIMFKDRAEFPNFELEEFRAEWTGIVHLVDILYPKGHSVCKQWSSIPLSLLILLKDRMVPSKDFHHSGRGAQAVKRYLTDTKRTRALGLEGQSSGNFRLVYTETL